MIDINNLKKLSSEEQLKKKIEIINNNDLINIPPFALPDVYVEHYLFISYSHKDFKPVYRDLFALQGQNIKTWYDKGMPAGKSWKDSANKYMLPRNCLGVLFYISENSLRSQAVFDELNYAYNSGKNRINVVLPFESDFVYKGESTKGKIYSPLEMYQILKENNQLEFEISEELLDKFFSDKILYQTVNTPIENRVNQIHNTLTLQPLLQIEPFNLDIQRMIDVADDEGLSIDDVDFTDTEDQKAYSVNDIFDTSIVNVNAEDFLLPNFYDGFTVEEDEYVGLLLSSSIFAHCTYLEKVTFPDLTAIEVGNAAFYGDKKLISLENGWIFSVKKEGFYNCHNLKDIGANKLQNVGEFAFYNCYNLESNINLFNPDISKFAFYNCHKIKSVNVDGPVFHKDTLSIGKYAFANCHSLETVNITMESTKVENSAFLNCKSLKNITFSGKLEEIEIDAFDGCDSLESINIEGINEYYKSVDGVLYKTELVSDKNGFILAKVPQNTKLKSIKLDNDVFGIDFHALEGLKSDIYFEVDKDNDTFYSDDGSLLSSDRKTLFFLRKMKEPIIPESVEIIAPYSLVLYKNVKNLNIGPNVKKIQDNGLFLEYIENLNLYGCPVINTKSYSKNIRIDNVHIYTNKNGGNCCNLYNVKAVYVESNLDKFSLNYFADIDVDEIHIAGRIKELIGGSYKINCKKLFIGKDLVNPGYIFNNNISLDEIIIDKENKDLKFKGNLLVSSDEKTLYKVLNSGEPIDLFEGLEVIGPYALQVRNQDIVLPNSVKELGEEAIYVEDANLTINDNITKITSHPITHIINGRSVYYIGSHSNPNYLCTEVYTEYEGDKSIKTNTKVIAIMKISTDVTSFSIQEGIVFINAIYGGYMLKELTIPSSIKLLSNRMFRNLVHLKTIKYNGTCESWNELVKVSNLKIDDAINIIFMK